jgi:hypothetical protein
MEIHTVNVLAQKNAAEASIAVSGEVDAAVVHWATCPFNKGLRVLLATLPEIWPVATAEDFPPTLTRRQEFSDGAVKVSTTRLPVLA